MMNMLILFKLRSAHAKEDCVQAKIGKTVIAPVLKKS